MTIDEFNAAFDKLVEEFWNSAECDFDPYELAVYVRGVGVVVEFRYEFGDEQ